MVVGICDDHAEERERIYKVCEMVLEQMGCPAEIALFEGASFVLQTSKKPDILILDIEMPGMTGIELKEVLQSEEGATYIIFVTDHEEMMTEAFGVHVLRFVEKENLGDKLPEALAQAIRMKRNNCIVHGTDSEKILYIYSDGNYIRMVTEEGEQPLIRESMKQLKKGLEDIGFIFDQSDHQKVKYYGDDRYTIIYASTPSDKGHGGKNNARTTMKKAF